MLSGRHYAGRPTDDCEGALAYYRDVLGGEIDAGSTDVLRVAFVEPDPGLPIEQVELEGEA